MSEFLDLTNKDIVKRIIQDIESDQNSKRKEEDFNSYQVMSGNQREFVTETLKEMFPESHKVMTPSNINVLKKVVGKVAKVYKDAPTRLVNGKKNENLDTIYKEGKFDRSFASMDKTYNRSRCVLNWVQNVPNFPTKFKLLPLAQHSFDVVIDNDTLELLMVILSYPDNDITTGNRETRSDATNQIIAESNLDSSATSKQYAIWTKEQHVQIKATTINKTTVIDYMVDPNNEEMKNELGIIPFVWTTSEPDIPEFPTPNPLAQESITINVMNSTLLTAATKQIGMLVLKYPQGSRVNQVHSGFSVALELPQSTDTDPSIETTAEYIVPTSDLAGMRETFLEYTAGVLSDNGLEGATLAGENKTFSSGLERLIASASIMDLRSENITTYTGTEESVFNIIKAYDVHNNTRLFGKDDVFDMVYPEPKVIVSEDERLDLIEKKDGLELLEQKDKFEIAYPGMTEKAIEEKMKRIADERAANIKSALKEVIEPNPKDDDGDNE